MNKNIKPTIAFLFLIGSTFLFSSCKFSFLSFKEIKKAILSNIPFVDQFTQKNYNTYTSITGIKDSMKLVTAKQQLDFINIMDGKDGRYLEISTFEVRAGIDCKKVHPITYPDGTTAIEYPAVEIFSSNKIHSINPRAEAEKRDADFYEYSISPVNRAYEQKAKDYAVELGILENAKRGAERTLKNLINAKIELNVESYKTSYEVNWLPYTMDIYSNYFSEHKMAVTPVVKDKFYRDSFIIKPTGNDEWYIRIGDSGQTFGGTFSEFYKNVFETNTREENSGNDRVEIFRYFDPMYPKESEVLGYSSDNFRTMFLLNDGHIYYIDAVSNSEETLTNLAPTMIYLASSLRKITDYHVENIDAYREYVSNYFYAQESIRNNESRVEIRNKTDRLVNSNSLRTSENEYNLEEKYFLAVADEKCLGRTKEQITVYQTGDTQFDNITGLIKDLLLLVSSESFATEEARKKAVDIASDIDFQFYRKNNKKAANTQYLETWFLQNAQQFKLSEQERKMFEEDIKTGDAYIASRPLIVSMDDTERNNYFYNLFRNRLASSQFFVDTAGVIEDDIKYSPRDTNMFVYYKIPQFEKQADGDILERLKKENGGYDITNSFILIFNQTEWNFGNVWKDNDLHAIVLDEATLRFFPNVGALNPIEKAIEKTNDLANTIMNNTVFKVVTYAVAPAAAFIIDGMRKADGSPVYFYYGDWENLRVTPQAVKIAGHDFATKKITKKGKESYRNSNDYAEKSVIAEVIDDLQHAYSNKDSEYYYEILCNNIDNYIQHYVYEKIFRPSPRMTIDTRIDSRMRYNANTAF